MNVLSLTLENFGLRYQADEIPACWSKHRSWFQKLAVLHPEEVVWAASPTRASPRTQLQGSQPYTGIYPGPLQQRLPPGEQNPDHTARHAWLGRDSPLAEGGQGVA